MDKIIIMWKHHSVWYEHQITNYKIRVVYGYDENYKNMITYNDTITTAVNYRRIIKVFDRINTDISK